MNHQNVTPEIRSKRVPRKAVIVFLITVCILLASLLVLQTMRLQREQERVSVAEATVDRAQELLDLADGDMLLLCSDGLSSYGDDMDILDICFEYPTEEICDKLVDYANGNGGHDNISVALIAV